jgi:hypothetical protein
MVSLLARRPGGRSGRVLWWLRTSGPFNTSQNRVGVGRVYSTVAFSSNDRVAGGRAEALGAALGGGVCESSGLCRDYTAGTDGETCARREEDEVCDEGSPACLVGCA